MTRKFLIGLLLSVSVGSILAALAGDITLGLSLAAMCLAIWIVSEIMD